MGGKRSNLEHHYSHPLSFTIWLAVWQLPYFTSRADRCYGTQPRSHSKPTTEPRTDLFLTDNLLSSAFLPTWALQKALHRHLKREFFSCKCHKWEAHWFFSPSFAKTERELQHVTYLSPVSKHWIPVYLKSHLCANEEQTSSLWQ